MKESNTRGIKFYLITAISGIVVIVTIISLYNGITVILPFLYLVPIILTAYYYPKKGPLFSVFVSTVYLLLIALFGATSPETWISAVNVIVTYIAVAVIVSYFSKNRISESPKEGTGDDIKDLELSYERLLLTEEELRQNLEELVRIQKQLREKERRLTDIIEFLPDATFAIDCEGKVIAWNKAIEEMTGISASEMLEKGEYAYAVPFYGKKRPILIDMIFASEEVIKELYPMFNRKDGKIYTEAYDQEVFEGRGVYFWGTASALFDADGNVVGAIECIRDITDKRMAEEELKASLKEKEILLKEIHHRVKNNMQVISSLLSLQSSFTKNEETHAILLECDNRVKSMAMVHENLYRSERFAGINSMDYIGPLVYEIASSYSISTPVDIIQDIDDFDLDIDTAIACGLIINELVSNSYKHAFVGRARGSIMVGMHGDEEKYSIIFSDDGVGFPRDLEFNYGGTFGIELVSLLTRQYNGDIVLDRENGTKFTISLPRKRKNCEIKCSNNN